MKNKILMTIISLFIVFTTSFASLHYVVFFTQNSNIPQNVSNKILLSKNFCLTVPIENFENITQNIDELIFTGKVEPALCFRPEPVFTILEKVYDNNDEKFFRTGAFADFINERFNDFKENIDNEKFGLLLNSGELSQNILKSFANTDIAWVNIDNTLNDEKGLYNIFGVNAFGIYKDFPATQKDVSKWLETKNEKVIPVLLTKKHLNNSAFMKYLIEFLDDNKNYVPALPTYLVDMEQSVIKQKGEIDFSETFVDKSILLRLSTASNAISEYKKSPNYDEYLYKNAQNEILYLCNSEILTGVKEKKDSSIKMFNATYDNIFGLLSLENPNTNVNFNFEQNQNANTKITKINGGVSIVNTGVIEDLSIYKSANTIKVDFNINFDDLKYVDIYIDMNNLDWAGSTNMLPGTNGYLTSGSGWEYAIRINKDKATLYRYSAEDASVVVRLNVNFGNSISIPQTYLRGNPTNWGYQAVAVSPDGNIQDCFSNSSAKAELLSKKPLQISAIRAK